MVHRLRPLGFVGLVLTDLLSGRCSEVWMSE